MNYSAIKKGFFYSFLMILFSLSAYAQKLEEKDLKLNVSKISNSSAQLGKLEPVTFQYVQKKDLKFPIGTQYGFSTEQFDPSSVLIKRSSRMYEAGKNNMKVARYDEVDVDKLIPLMVSAIKEQQAEIEELKSQLNLLKSQAK
jgi:hypothetical protein